MKKIILLLLVMVFLPNFVFSQSTGGFSGLESQLMQNSLKDQLSAKDLISNETMPVGNIVVPENYYFQDAHYISPES